MVRNKNCALVLIDLLLHLRHTLGTLLTYRLFLLPRKRILVHFLLTYGQFKRPLFFNKYYEFIVPFFFNKQVRELNSKRTKKR
jgi:hypothetical protein